jgi:hypothetical protein
MHVEGTSRFHDRRDVGHADIFDAAQAGSEERAENSASATETRRVTERAGRMSIGEPHPFPGQSVDLRGCDSGLRVVATGIAIAEELCRAWNWVQPNGRRRDMVCRGLMLALHRSGQIRLPARRKTPPNPLAKRSKPAAIEVDRRPVETSLATLGPLRFEQVRRTAAEGLFNRLIDEHHYLRYTQPSSGPSDAVFVARGLPANSDNGTGAYPLLGASTSACKRPTVGKSISGTD